MGLRFRLLLIGVLLGQPVGAEAPAGAIDWLNEAINNPPEFTTAPETPPLVSVDDIASEKKGLQPVSPNAAGLLAPNVTGLPVDMWGDTKPGEIVQALQGFPRQGLPAVHQLFRHILLAQADPPVDPDPDALVLQARVSRLFDIGALDPAEALLTLARPETPSLFAPSFDIAILTDRTLEVCKLLQDVPAITNDIAARVYCLARGGDWNAAAITLSLGATIGAIDDIREQELLWFLDPVMFEDAAEPPIPDPLQAFDFVLRETLALPRPGGLLPLPYIYQDTSESTPPRIRMEASERLVRSGAIPSNVLFLAYRNGKPAASGGVWARQQAIQALDAALAQSDPAEIARAIDVAVPLMRHNGLLPAMASEYGRQIAALPYDPAFGDSLGTMLDLAFLDDRPAPDLQKHIGDDPYRTLAADIVSGGKLDQIADPDAIMRAITQAFGESAPESPKSLLYSKLLLEGRVAQAILASSGPLSFGAAADPGDIETGLYVLIKADQSAEARRIAVQILLLRGDI